MGERIALIGAGEHACVVAAAATAAGCDVVGAVGAEAHPQLPCPHLGTTTDPDQALALAGDAAWLMAIGIGERPGFRAELLRRWDPSPVRWATVVHPRAWVADDALLGAGVFVGPNAVVQTGAVIGDHAIINTAAVCEHHCRIGRESHLGPGCLLGGGCQVGERSFLGLGAVVRDHIVIGDDVVIAMGAVVVASVPAAARLAGVPARPLGTG